MVPHITRLSLAEILGEIQSKRMMRRLCDNARRPAGSLVAPPHAENEFSRARRPRCPSRFGLRRTETRPSVPPQNNQRRSSELRNAFLEQFLEGDQRLREPIDSLG